MPKEEESNKGKFYNLSLYAKYLDLVFPIFVRLYISCKKYFIF